LCKHCGECGHIQRDCPAHKEETARKEYGDYFHEILDFVMSFVPKDITTLSTVLSNTLDLASFIVSSIFSNGSWYMYYSP
jgi:hypothetical protein